MDPELLAYLKAMESRAIARDAETRQQMEAMEKRSVARDADLKAEIADARREAGVMFEAILKEVRALPEGLSTHQRREADRLDATREEAMLNEHILPLEAVAADHEERIKAMEQAH